MKFVKPPPSSFAPTSTPMPNEEVFGGNAQASSECRRNGDWLLAMTSLLACRDSRMFDGELRFEESRLLIVWVMKGASMSFVKARL